MKFSTSLSLAALAASQAAAHATFQDLWVNGQDYAGTCVRKPNSNSPVTSVTSADIVCNANSGPVSGKCPVPAGGTVTVEIHQQAGDRTCGSPAIGGAHWGPITAYLSKVADSSTADGAAGGWFKIFEDGWAKNPASANGDGDWWGVKDIEACCGKMNVKIPADIPAGDYLLRAEAIALHSASPSGGAQFYMSCFQLTVTGGGTASPATVKFPGAYSASDPGIGLSIHGTLNSYIVPGPAVYSGGSTRVAGSGTCTGAETNTGPGPVLSTASATRASTTLVTLSTTKAGGVTTSTGKPVSTTSSSGKPVATTTSAAGTGGGGGSPLYGQCGGIGWTGPTTCAQGKCVANGAYYSQCTP